MRTLHVWSDGRHVGAFSESADGVGFAYDDDAPQVPISVSLPREGGWNADAPLNFLENLLPDSANAREIMRYRLAARSADTFDLLDSVDSTGGLVFTLDAQPPSDVPVMEPASDDAVAAEIRRISHVSDTWWDDEGRSRFSLGGAQGKFTLTSVDGQWFWPNAALPSTHIVKPQPHNLSDLIEVEHASMQMARRCGLPVPENGSIEAKNARAYIVERFDRVPQNGRIVRLRQEDFLQAMGRPTKDKYEVTVDECLELLHHIDETNALTYQWLERLAFNTSIGNCDAHAKNYSLMIDDEMGFLLAPIYDVVLTRYWPEFNWELAMPLDDAAKFAEWTGPRQWKDLALRHGLDAERVVYTARTMAGKVLAYGDQVLADADIDAHIATHLKECWIKVNESADPIEP